MISRSYLFVPGHRPDRFDKACASGADVVILDLEDAVGADDKPRARDEIGAWLQARAREKRATPRIAVRVNGTQTPWFVADLAVCRRPGIDCVLLPKAEHVDAIADVARVLPSAAVVVPIVESALGVERGRALAAAPRVARLAFGTLDLRVDLGLLPDSERAPDDDEPELAPFRSQLVLASRLAGIEPPIDGVTAALDDAARVEADARRARRFGFGGKLCIHPRQVAAVHRAFDPSPAQVDWARRVLDAVRASGGSAVQVDGRMVDRPVILEAESILARAGRG